MKEAGTEEVIQNGANYTREIRIRQQEIDALANQRLQVIYDLRRRGVPYKVLSEGIGLAEQTVYRILREAKKK